MKNEKRSFNLIKEEFPSHKKIFNSNGNGNGIGSDFSYRFTDLILLAVFLTQQLN
jgi:hypothetical protein